MIPEAFITHWRNVAPWPQDSQVEQDLILSRALVEIFHHPSISSTICLRGGTALHKLYIPLRLRYSEDIDLVQTVAGPIGPLLNATRSLLDPLLGKPTWGRKADSVTVQYRMVSEISPVKPIRLKIEINTREHFHVFPLKNVSLSIDSPWFKGRADIRTYCIEELLG